jgi:sn-1 stearoyl-lipid 9-desaturase
MYLNLEELARSRMATPDDNINWVTATVMVLFHIGALAALFFFTWKALVVAAFLWWLSTSLGIGVCYHRLLTHRGYKTPRWLEYLLTVFATLSLEGGPIFWVATHRIHHRFSDQEGDPHSPRDGKWWAHAGWILVGKSMHHDASTLGHYVPDLAKDRFHVWITKYHYLPLIVLGVILLAVGGLPMFLWGICVRTVVGLHSTWAVNSATHSWGSRRFRTRDDSTNSWWVALVTWGEGWHNNHHAHPSSSRHGLKWYEIDLNWYAIWTMQKVGLASNVYRYKLPGLSRRTQPSAVANAVETNAETTEAQSAGLPQLGTRFERAWKMRGQIFSFRDLAARSAESASAIGNKILPAPDSPRDLASA